MKQTARVRRRQLLTMAALVAGGAAAVFVTRLLLPEWPDAPTHQPPKFPSRYAVRGIDVSHHAGQIDWAQVAAAGVHFAWLKASEGADLRDRRFVENARGAQDAGLLVGPYHFFTFCRSGEEQARHYLEVIAEVPRTLPAAVDVESVGNCANPPDPSVIRQQLEVFLETVERTLGERLVVYSISGEGDGLVHGLARPRWRRSIGREPVGQWAFWQFDPSARVPGISRAVDLDVFAGERGELEGLRAR